MVAAWEWDYSLGGAVVDEVGEEDADGDVELEQDVEPSADPRRRDLGQEQGNGLHGRNGSVKLTQFGMQNTMRISTHATKLLKNSNIIIILHMQIWGELLNIYTETDSATQKMQSRDDLIDSIGPIF